jgi:hypothetical protein
MSKHIADAESKFVVVNVTPDFCRVDGEVCAFDISQELSSERLDYSPNVYARGKRVLIEGSVVRGVNGNAGAGLGSGVSLGSGDVVMSKCTEHFHVNGRRVCRHDDLCLMNVRVGS